MHFSRETGWGLTMSLFLCALYLKQSLRIALHLNQLCMLNFAVKKEEGRQKMFCKFCNLVILWCSCKLFWGTPLETVLEKTGNFYKKTGCNVTIQWSCRYLGIGTFKVGLSPSKIFFIICFNDSPSKTMKNTFYFILKALLLSQDI